MNFSRFTNPANNEPLAVAKTFVGHDAPVSDPRVDEDDSRIERQEKCQHDISKYADHVWRCHHCGKLFARQAAEWLLGTKMKAD